MIPKDIKKDGLKRNPKDAFQYDMELIKFCHEDRTREEIKNFKSSDGKTMSERKLSTYLNKPVSYSICGMEFINTIIDHKDDSGKTVFVASSSGSEELDQESNRNETIEHFDSVNPIFLALNLSEVYLMSEYFLNLVKEHDSDMLDVCEHVVSKIYCQLSDYSRNRLETNFNLSTNAKELLQYESEKRSKNKILYGLAVTRKRQHIDKICQANKKLNEYNRK